MSENLNIVPEPSAGLESLESLSRNDTSDFDRRTEDANPQNYTNTLDVSVLSENCDESNCLISTEKNTLVYREIDIKDAEISNDNDKLIDVHSENMIDQIGINVTNSNESSLSVFDQVNSIVTTDTNAIKVALEQDETDKVNSKDITDFSTIDDLQSIRNNDLSESNIKDMNEVSKEITSIEDNEINENSTTSEEHKNTNNVILNSETCQKEKNQNDSSGSFFNTSLNSEVYQEDQNQNESSEIFLKTSLNSEVLQGDQIQNDSCEMYSKTSSSSEVYQEDQIQNGLNEIFSKTSTRPQRQAAKKAENQIREIAKEIIKPIDCVDEKIIDKVEALSSPLKKVCCQCNRFRLCKFTVKDHKSIYLCQEECVSSYRKKNGQFIFEKKCEQCLSLILENDDKSYSWQSKHFCSIDCLSNYQNTVFDSNCINCKNIIKMDSDLGKYCRFISGKILQFCGTDCIENYENGLQLCSFCQKELFDSDFDEFCSSFCQTKDCESRKKHIEPDSSGDYVMNEMTKEIDKCNVCFCKLSSSTIDDIQIFYTNNLFKFCSNECLNKFIISKKRTVSCSLCKIKKFNFDMISIKNVSSISPTYICSLSCLNKQQESPQLKSKKVVCDKCGLQSQSRFKTVINSSNYNFCSQNCLNSFQSNKKSKYKSKSKNEKTSCTSRLSGRKSVRKEDNILSDSDEETNNSQHKTSKIKNKIRRKISYESIDVPTTVDKEIQTDQTGSKSVIIPVPVPVYIPFPMHMYVMPYPVPVPIPIPLPIPIFIPTTKNTAKGIFKDIKKIKEVTPADPFEAELLLMAGMVADEPKIDNNLLSESEDDMSNDEYNDDTKVSSSARNHNSFGDDVLAIALNIAGADTQSLDGVDNITANNQANHIIDDVEANLVSSTIMPQTSDPAESITQENMISSPQDMLCRPPRKRAPRTQSQRSSNSKRSRKNEYQPPPCIQSSSGLIQQQQQQQQQLVHNPLYSIPMPVVKPDANMCLKYTLGVNAWRQWASMKSIEFEKALSSNVCGVKKTNIFKLDLLQLTASELNYCLCLFVKEVCKPNGSDYAPDTVYYLCLGVQQYLFENGRIDNIFTDIAYEQFTDNLNEIAKRFTEIYSDTKFIVTRVEEEYLWESKQLGAHSPYVLLCTLIFFNTKHFNLTNVDEHMQLSFSHIMKHWKRNPNQPSTSGVKAPGTYRNVLLRFYPPQASIDSPNSRKKKVYEQHENEENPLRCPVKLYEFYLSKCPESVKTRNDLFYLTPERSCVPDSPVWYSTCALNKESLEKMLYRVKMVKEINVALLTT